MPRLQRTALQVPCAAVTPAGMPKGGDSVTLSAGGPGHDAPGGGRGAPMSAIYFTLTAVVLYLVADWLLRQMENHAGRRFEYRTLIFFGLLLGLALLSFGAIRRLSGE